MVIVIVMSTKAKRTALKVAEALKVVKKSYDHALSETKTQIDELEEEVLEIIKTMQSLPASLLQFSLQMRNCSEAITKLYKDDHPLVLSATVNNFSDTLKSTFLELPHELVRKLVFDKFTPVFTAQLSCACISRRPLGRKLS